MRPTSPSTRRWLFLVPLGIGVAAAVWLLRSGQDPEHLPEREVARPVRVIEAPSLAAVPRAVGYGSVEPGTTWQAIAEVGGRVVEVHDRLEVGAILRAGAVLLRIDRADYDLALAEAKADHQATEAQLAELAAREENARASLAIEREAFDLAMAELERQEKLAAQGAVSRSALESQKRSTLAQRQRVQAEANMLNLVPAERQVLQARLERLRSLIFAAERDIERTTVILPFDGRIAALATELGQVATPGQVLVEADGITVAEVAAQVPVSHMRGLIPAADSLGSGDHRGEPERSLHNPRHGAASRSGRSLAGALRPGQPDHRSEDPDGGHHRRGRRALPAGAARHPAAARQGHVRRGGALRAAP